MFVPEVIVNASPRLISPDVGILRERSVLVYVRRRVLARVGIIRDPKFMSLGHQRRAVKNSPVLKSFLRLGVDPEVCVAVKEPTIEKNILILRSANRTVERTAGVRRHGHRELLSNKILAFRSPGCRAIAPPRIVRRIFDLPPSLDREEANEILIAIRVELLLGAEGAASPALQKDLAANVGNPSREDTGHCGQGDAGERYDKDHEKAPERFLCSFPPGEEEE